MTKIGDALPSVCPCVTEPDEHGRTYCLSLEPGINAELDRCHMPKAGYAGCPCYSEWFYLKLIGWTGDELAAYAERRTTRKAARNGIPPKKRFAVLARDGFRCGYCGRRAGEGAELVLDHIRPVADGGTDDEDNLRAACVDCNAAKGALSL